MARVKKTTDRNYEQRIINIVAECLGVAPAAVKPDSLLVEQLKADSLDTLEIAREIESQLRVRLSDKMLKNIVTVADLIKCVTAELQH